MAKLTTDLLTGVQFLLNIDLPVSGSSIIETDPTVPNYIKQISSGDIANWNSKQPAGNYQSASGFTAHATDLNIHYAQSGITITESQVTNLSTDLANRSLTGHTHSQYLTTENDPTVPDNVKAITTGDTANWNSKQPAGDYVLTPTFTGHTSDLTIHYQQSGITITENQVTNLVNDLAGKSSTGHTHTGVYQPIGAYLVTADIAGKEDSSNKVTIITSGSTNTQYPSAKLLYDQLATKQPTGAYLTSFTETDPTVPANVKAITTGDTTNWNSKQASGDYVLTPTFTGHTANATIHYAQSGITITESQVTNLVNDLAGKSSTGHTHTGVYQPVGSYLVAADITGKEDSSNKVTIITSGSTNTQYPSAKLLYDQLATKQPTGAYLLPADITGKMNLNQASRQTIINGAPTFSEGLTLGTNPTGTTFEAGKIYYDAPNKTLGICIDTDVTIQLGQEELVLCYNNTGADIPNGMMVYPTGANGDMPTIALARADNTVLGSFLDIGMTTQVIPNGQSGFVTNRGIVHNIDTSAFVAGDTLYLSTSVWGGVTKVPPTSIDDFLVKVGVALMISPTVGSIYVRQILNNRITDLVDVAIDTPIVDQTLVWNGLNWINKNLASVNAGIGVNFYLDDTQIITGGTQSVALHTLSKVPVTTTEVIDQVTLVTGNLTQILDRYLYDVALGGTQIDAGAWGFNTYCMVNNSGGIATIPVTMRKVVAGTGTVTITGTGTSRTATVSGGTPFVAGDVNANMTLSGLLRTSTAIFRIIAYTSTSVVTVETLTTYVNEANVAYSNHKFLFTDNITEINQTTVGLTTTNSFQPAFSINATDKLGVTYYGQSDTNNRTVTLYHNGTTHYTNFTTPLVIRHNDLSGLQGGTSTERYHVPAATATLLAALTSTSDELNALHGIPSGLTATELGYVDGVTSSIQTQLNAKLGKVRTTYSITGATTLSSTHAGATIECNGTFALTLGNATQQGTIIDIVNVGTGIITLAASTTILSRDGLLTLSKQYSKVTAYHQGSNIWIIYDILPSELIYLSGTTSNVQTQLNAKLSATNNKLIPSDFVWTGTLTGSNLTWVITYSHTISGNVTIPSGVTLVFMGGSLNGITTLTGTNTKIIADDANIISATTIDGTWYSDHVWFKWFGAKGDAVTDDYVKGQQLLDWAYSNHSMKVYMGVGRFNVTASGFTIKTDFEGEGNRTYGYNSEIYNRTTAGYGVKIAERYIALANFTVYGNATANYGVGATCGDGVLFDGTIYTGIQYVTLRNVVSIRNSYGFRFTGGAWLINIYDSYAIENLYDGFNCDSAESAPTNTGQKNDINYYSCTSTGNGRNGWTIWGMSLHFYGCDAELNYGSGVDITSVLSPNRTFDVDNYNTLISGMHFEGNGRGSIHVAAGIYNGHYFYCRGLIVEGCYSYEDTALFKGGWVNSILFESYGSVNEGTGAIRTIRIEKNTFTGSHAVYCNFNGLLDAQSSIDLPTDTHYVGFGRAANPNQYRTLVVSGYFYAKGVTWTNVLRSETVATGTVVAFPLTLPTNCNIQQYKIWVQTDATNYTVTFNTISRDALAGIGAYSNSLIYSDAITGNSGSKLVNSSTTGNYTASNRVVEASNDMYLTITITIITPGTYLYLGNPVILYKP